MAFGVSFAFAVEALLAGGAGLFTVRYFRILSSFFGPIPFMAWRSSTLLNDPYDLRACRIFSAVEGPIPGTCCSSAEVAVLRLTGCSGGFFFAQSPCVAQSTRSVVRKQKLNAVLVLHPTMDSV